MNQDEQNLYRVTGSGLGSSQQVLKRDFGKFNAGEAYSMGWKVFKDNFWFVAGVSLVWYIIYIMASQSCFGIVAIPHLLASGTFLGLSLVRRAPRFEAIFDGFNQFGRVLGAGAFLFLIAFGFMLIVGIPMIILFAANILPDPETLAGGSEDVFAFIILGVLFIFAFFVSILYYYVLARWHLVFPLIVERDYPVMEAIQTSWQVTREHQWSLFLLKFLSIQVLPVLGALLCCVGFPFLTGLGFAYDGAAAAMYLGTEPPEKNNTISPQSRTRPQSDELRTPDSSGPSFPDSGNRFDNDSDNNFGSTRPSDKNNPYS